MDHSEKKDAEESALFHARLRKLHADAASARVGPAAFLGRKGGLPK